MELKSIFLKIFKLVLILLIGGQLISAVPNLLRSALGKAIAGDSNIALWAYSEGAWISLQLGIGLIFTAILGLMILANRVSKLSKER